MSAPSNKPVPTVGTYALSSGNATNDATQHDGIIFPSASRGVTSFNSADILNSDCKGIRLFITNDAAGGGTVTVKIQVKDPATGNYTDLAGAASAALGAVTSSIVTIYPGLTGIADAAGVTINQHLGPVFRVVLTVGTATVTCGVGADFLV
jgi:hypothetical protein